MSPEDRAWHATRAKNIGSSEVASLFGCQPPYAPSHFALWMAKAGRVSPPEVSGERPRWGLLLEDAIAEAVRQEKGWKIERPLLRYCPHARIDGMGCTLDFEAARTLDAEQMDGVIDAKNADWLVHKRQWGDEPPIHIGLQLQHQLACTGAAWGAVACLVGGNHLEVYEVKRRPKIIAEIEKRVAAFWQSIADGKEPPVDGSDSTAGALRALFPEDDGSDEPADLSADNALPELCRDLIKYRSLEAEAKDGADGARNAILSKMGTHRRAVCQGYSINAPAIEDSPGTLITPAMVGTYYGARKGSRRVTAKEIG